VFVNNLFRVLCFHNDQMENWKLIATKIIEHPTNEHDFLSQIFTGPETWVFAYDSMIKSQTSERTQQRRGDEKMHNWRSY